MPSKEIVTRRILITKKTKEVLFLALYDSTLEEEKVREITDDISDRLNSLESLEALNLEFKKIIDKYTIFRELSLELEILEKDDLDREISDLMIKLIEKKDFDKAIRLGNQVLFVYSKNPDIKLDDFRQELLKKWKFLTTKQNLKMHKTIEQRKEEEANNRTEPAKKAQNKIHLKSVPIEEGQILQQGDIFSKEAPSDYHDLGDDIDAPELDLASLKEKKDKIKTDTKKIGKLFKEASSEVTEGTSTKLKDKAIKWLAKGQEKLEKRKEKKKEWEIDI